MSGTEAQVFAGYLREHAHRYFREMEQGEVRVNLAGERRRSYSALYRFEIEAAGLRRFVFVKVPSSRGESRGDERPYVIPETDPTIKFQLHYTALAAIHDHFESLCDPRFGTVRVLDLLPDRQAFVMEEVPDSTLYKLLPKVSRLRFTLRAPKLEVTFRNAGAWLRVYHALPNLDETEVIHAGRDEYLEMITKFTNFLARALDDELYFRGVASRVRANALEALPEVLPLGIRFGDYGMTNVLAGPNGRVTGIDTLARWRTPIYEDIAYFLTVLKTIRSQVASQGLAFNPKRLAKYEHEFLFGYFEHEPIPYREIRLFEILRLLEKWSAKASRMSRKSAGRFAAPSGFGLTLTNRFYRRRLGDLLHATAPAMSQGLFTPRITVNGAVSGDDA